MDTLIYEHIIHGLSSFLWRQCENTCTQLWRAYAKKTNDTKAFSQDYTPSADTRLDRNELAATNAIVEVRDASTVTDAVETREIVVRNASANLPGVSTLSETFTVHAVVQLCPTEVAGPVTLYFDAVIQRVQWDDAVTEVTGSAATVVVTEPPVESFDE